MAYYAPSVKVNPPEILQYFAHLDAVQNSLPENYKKIIEDFKAYHTKNNGLTESQLRYLTSIYDKYSTESVAAQTLWQQEFTPEMRNKLKIVCEYYQHTGFFAHTVESWKKNPDFIPSKENYEKITGNKYASRLIETHTSEPTFQKGDLATVRSNVSWSSIDSGRSGASPAKMTGRTVFIVDNNVIPSGEIHRWCSVFVLENPDGMFKIRENVLKKYKAKK